jgi:nuclear transcription factor Y alpha
MATQTFYFKEHDGLGPLSSVLPWLGAFGSQQVYGESYGQSKPFTMELPNSGHQLTATKQHERGIEQGLDKGNTNQFTIFPGNLAPSIPLLFMHLVFYRYFFTQLSMSIPRVCNSKRERKYFSGFFIILSITLYLWK